MTAAMLLESALRAMVMAAVVAGGLRVLRVQHVMARKLAWCLVLLTALAMPLLMRRAVVVRVPGLESVQQFVRLRSAFAAAEMPAAPSASVSDPMAAAEGSDVSGMVPDRAMNRSGMGVQGTVAPAERKATLRRASHGVTRSARATEPQKAIFAAGAACLTATPHTTGRSGWMTAAHAKSAILFIWAAGSAILFLRLLTGLVLALRLWMRAEPASVLVEPRGAVRISDAVKTPVTVGNGIVLPEVYAEWGRKKLRMVLAHELAHVRQGDFWLQLMASVYCCIFWFSPVGWWVRQQLSELGEAVSDRAALEESIDTSSYAEVLLEFAGMPDAGRGRMMASVAMARSGSVRKRIEMLLAEGQFARAFASGRKHAALALMLVPCAALASVVTPSATAGTAVQTEVSTTAGKAMAPVAPAQANPAAVPAPSAAPGPASPAPAPVVAVTVPGNAPQAPAAPQAMTITVPAPAVPLSTLPAPVAPFFAVPVQAPLAMTLSIPDSPAPMVSLAVPVTVPPLPAFTLKTFEGALALPPQAMAAPMTLAISRTRAPDALMSYQVRPEKDGTDSCGAWAIVSGDSKGVSGSGSIKFFEKAQQMKGKEHGSFVVFSRDRKTYVIDDPALVAQAKGLFTPMGNLGVEQIDWAKMQANMAAARANMVAAQKNLNLEHLQITVPKVDMEQAKASLEAALKQLNELEKMPEMQQPELSELQQKIAEAQRNLTQAQIENHLDHLQPRMDEVQGQLKEQLTKFKAEMDAWSAQRSKAAAENEQKIKSLLDQALKDGRAKQTQ